MPKVEKVTMVTMSPQQQLALKLFEDFRASYIKMSANNQEDVILFQRMCILALSQLAAVLAVDVAMQPDQFLNVCRCNFDEAYKNAPKFG